MVKAHSVPLTGQAVADLKLRTVEGDQRTIEGWASLPVVDHIGDQILPEGAKYELPHPLLMGHAHDSPVGQVTHATVSKSGIRIKATIARIPEPGPLRDLCDRAWQSVKANLITGLSVGFRPIEYEPLPGSKGGLRYKVWRWFETSLVAIPACPGARITATRGAHEMSCPELSPEVRAIMDRFEAEGAERLARLELERCTAAERSTQQQAPDVAKHLERRYRYECGRHFEPKPKL